MTIPANTNPNKTRQITNTTATNPAIAVKLTREQAKQHSRIYIAFNMQHITGIDANPTAIVPQIPIMQFKTKHKNITIEQT